MAKREESSMSYSNGQPSSSQASSVISSFGAEPIGSEWLPLLDYAMKTGLSLSTLRRYIKANKVQYKVERGRYLLRDDGREPATGASMAPQKLDTANGPAGASANPALSKLQNDLERAKEEIAELKTLIAFYEERMSRGSVSRDS